MFPYKTNSADYLDYVASVLSREQIQSDPELCLLLENEYIKDNTEMAIRWNVAKYGDYQDKYDFVEYFMANGTELDADTILHYRAKSFNDPVIMEIAYAYFSNMGNIAEIRKSKYNKETDDCFKNPCFYLGRFSGVMGMLGDVENTYGPFTFLSNRLRGKGLKSKQITAHAQQQAQQGQITKEQAAEKSKRAKQKEIEESEKSNDNKDVPIGSADVIAPANSNNVEDENRKTPSIGSKCFMTLIPETFQKGAEMWWKQVTDGSSEFSDEILESTNCLTNAERIGDWTSSKFSEMFELISKANVRRQLGDCGRLWSQVRRMNFFSPNNAYGPIRPDQKVGNTNPDGTKDNPLGKPNPTVKDANPNVNSAHEVMTTLRNKK